MEKDVSVITSVIQKAHKITEDDSGYNLTKISITFVPFNAADVHCRSVPHHRSSKLVFRFTSYDGLSIANYHDHSIANYVYHDQSCANYDNPTFASWDDLSFANYDGLNHCKLQAIGFQNKLIFLQLRITFS